MVNATLNPLRVGIIGAGNVSNQYLRAARFFRAFTVVAIADLDAARARAQAETYGVPRACTVGELLADPEIELIINLTIPSAHAAVSTQIIEAGKSVYSEKPLATARDDARALLALAAEKGVRVGCAPDTFLGGGLQTCCKLIDDGWIGRPIAVTAFMLSRGMEMWHPDPAFFYQPGAGPLFDLGPYYLTALVNLMGPMAKVAGSAVASFPERVVTSQPNFGARIPVGTPTHVTALLTFASGAVGTLLTSFDVWASELPRIEVYGTEGTLSVPDPNTFGGPVRLKRGGAEVWSELPLTHGYTDNSRGLGVADMAHALRSGRDHRASGELAFHVLDAMQAVLEAAEAERTLELTSCAERPAPLPLGLLEGILDD
ncbi:Gfo/Idh/MocA family protein [Truepera radiovictrix]|uniref:Oxidoreductase domain protein n=1 Tax=Truepera radiovictrix (strain DSM 17093 / CIP 108686 / LMG 22925 / RQ-24) TaxID=649638 RepID=D7CUN6_TRURR|nr:Gfo/Idh/MocA family oxidoreductase [Truepera radiovictrix]ADI14027.1 oxidoreductase domain protein [Truepera radiovictrix DSM 17093]WMT57413.1 Gfo/Idh/MocA family oxidoreductase [Truepera radiovictrix]